jgi:hypothetical protein
MMIVPEETHAHKQPIRKSVRLPMTSEPEIEFRITSYPMLRSNSEIVSPEYRLNHSTWRLTVIPPLEEEDVGELSFLRVKVMNMSHKNLTCSIQGGVWGMAAPQDPSMVTGDEDCSFHVKDAFHAGVADFKVNGVCDMVCKGVTWESLKDITCLGISTAIHVYGEPEVVDNTNVISTHFPQLSFREYTLGRDMASILTITDAKKKVHAMDTDGIDTLDNERVRMVRSSASVSSSSSSSDPGAASNVPPNLVVHERTLSDITLVARGHSERIDIHAHKCILAARSAVFRKKLTRPLANMQLAFSGNRYQLGSITPAVAKELVSFMYSDDISPLVLAQHAVPLLIAAAKYQVEGLVLLCEHYLIENITPDCAAIYLQLSTEWRLKELEAAASMYIATHIDDVRAQDYSWSSLSASQCRILLQLSTQSALHWSGEGPVNLTASQKKGGVKADSKDKIPTPTNATGDFMDPMVEEKQIAG